MLQLMAQSKTPNKKNCLYSWSQRIETFWNKVVFEEFFVWMINDELVDGDWKNLNFLFQGKKQAFERVSTNFLIIAVFEKKYLKSMCQFFVISSTIAKMTWNIHVISHFWFVKLKFIGEVLSVGKCQIEPYFDLLHEEKV